MKRKNLDLDDETLHLLNVLAAYNYTNTKKYCEEVLRKHAQENKGVLVKIEEQLKNKVR